MSSCEIAIFTVYNFQTQKTLHFTEFEVFRFSWIEMAFLLSAFNSGESTGFCSLKGIVIFLSLCFVVKGQLYDPNQSEVNRQVR